MGHSISKLHTAIQELDSLFREESFVEPCSVHNWRFRYASLYEDVHKKTKSLLFRIGLVSRKSKRSYKRFVEIYQASEEKVHSHNRNISRQEALKIRRLICPIEGRDLDLYQLSSIAMDVRTRLVIAGAGTGKTSTVVGLVRYLLLSGKAKADEILVLSFTNSTVSDLDRRIRDVVGSRVDVSTFHRLGIRIIAKCDGLMPKVTSIDLQKFVSEELLKNMADPMYMTALNQYMLHDGLYDGDDLENNPYRRQYLEENPLISLKGEVVKSYGEADIANYLYISGIRYEYEGNYEYDTRTEDHGQYRPDFHIIGTNIYIEYFGIDRDGNVAPTLVCHNGRDPKDSYRESMEWKRRIHFEKGTILVELFAYERSEGILIDRLEAYLSSLSIKASTSENDAYCKITGGRDVMFNRITSQLATCILLIKGAGGWDAYPSGNSIRQRMSMRRLERVLQPIYDSYCKRLIDAGEIDFEDMLGLASSRIKAGAYEHPYRYVIIDEFQDISRSRMNLILAMRFSDDFSLFCVGDDWQSIYGFNGSDVGYILDFDKYFGPSEVCKLQTTYRFSGQLLEVSCKFMNNNPRQIHKDLAAGVRGDTGLKILTTFSQSQLPSVVADALDKVSSEDTIFFLSRYRHDIVVLDGNMFRWKPRVNGQVFDVSYAKRPELRIEFMTIHGSKGLQADHVFILNNRVGPGGFPSFRPEQPIMEILLEGGGSLLDEERRLFYVALTRARKCSYLLSVRGEESIFVKEIRSQMEPESVLRCPMCGGVLVVRESNGGKFYGCSNYKDGCRFTRKISK